MGSPYKHFFDVANTTTTLNHFLFHFCLWILKNIYAVNDQLLEKCEGSSDRNQYCNFVKFVQKEDSLDMFLIFTFIVGTVVYLQYNYLARLIVVHGSMKICASVLLGQIMVVCSMLVSHKPIKAFKRAFGIEHKKKGMQEKMKK